MSKLPAVRHGAGEREHRVVILWVDGSARYVCCRERWFRVAAASDPFAIEPRPVVRQERAS